MSHLMGIFLLLSFGLIAQEKTFFYYDDGSIESNGYLMKNKKEGVWVYYHQNGKIKEKGTYKSGIKDGPWVYHTEEGKRDYYIEYIKGEKIFQRWYNHKNNVRYFVRYQPDSVPN